MKKPRARGKAARAKALAKKALGRAVLRSFGWREEGVAPTEPRYVLIAAPHTSNWDFPFTIALSFVFEVPIRWMGKHSLFAGPFGWFFRAMGGVPVVRHERRNMVDQMVALFEENDRLVLVVPAEGTRSRRPHWKSGFYHIAKNAGVPVICGYLDYGRRRGGFGPPIHMSGNATADMSEIRAFYADVVGKYPEHFGPIRLREEMVAVIHA